MSNFTVISIVVACLFVSVVLIVDHIEVARTNRIYHQDIFNRMRLEQTQSFEAYCKEIGLEDGTLDEVLNAYDDWERITKILKTTM